MSNLTRRLLVRFLSALFLLTTAGWLVAQGPPGSRKGEEEEEKKPVGPRTVLSVDDQEPEPPAVIAPDLDREARDAEKARQNKLRDLFDALKVRHDQVEVNGKRLDIKPVRLFLAGKEVPPGPLTLHRIDARNGDALGPPLSVKVESITAFIPYEQLAAVEVELRLKGLTGNAGREPLLAAAAALEMVLRFHDAERQRGWRQGAGWDGAREKLRAQLRDVRLRILDVHAEAREWPAVLALADRLAGDYPRDAAVWTAVLERRLAWVDEQTGKTTDTAPLMDAARTLDQAEGHLAAWGPSDFMEQRQRLTGLRQRLRDRAGELLQQVRKLADQNDPAAARTLLREVVQIAADAPGLQELRTRLQGTAPQVLRVGARSVPEYLSPAAAVTDAERLALDLLFESLVRAVEDPMVGQRFEPILSTGRPLLLPLGRQFQLVPGARWSNAEGDPVTASDVQGTVQLLRQAGSPGFVPEWADLVEGARVHDRDRVLISLSRGYLEPLSLMTFKVLPAGRLLKRADDPLFARRPIGSGPFRVSGDGGKAAPGGPLVLEANPHYTGRPLWPEPPVLRQIQFLASRDPVADFRNERLHLLLDLSTAQMAALRDARLPYVRLVTRPNRRVYFLAVNHRNPVLQNVDLRQALAHAIDRKAILDKCFRAGAGEKLHRPLTGPYPPGSWPSDPKLEGKDLHSPQLAQFHAGKARIISGQHLSLRYPAGDEKVKEACLEIKAQVARHVGIQIDLDETPLSASELARKVELDHDYDLAYYHWDFADESYWLWPLFDPRGAERGGRNFLGYANDGDLESRFRQLLAHRDFRLVRELSHEIHQQISTKLPFIPLWQLDSHFAIHEDLKFALTPGEWKKTVADVPFDPMAFFADVCRWKLVPGKETP